MQKILESHKTSVTPSTVALAANSVDMLVERAKCDRKGVYWPVAPIFKQIQAAKLDTTLGAGTPGVVLALVEYYRTTRDSTVRELIVKATAWLEAREQSRGFAPGFYFGSGGSWYLNGILRELLPDLPPFLSDQGNFSLVTAAMVSASGGRAALSEGCAGTLIGALSAWPKESALDSTSLQSLVGLLPQRAHLSPSGVFWDFYPHTVRAPTGFLNGSAGVDYALAGAKRILGNGYSELVASSLRHANAMYDDEIANWPDYEGVEMLRKLGDGGLYKIALRTRGGRAAEATAVQDCLGWATGTAGILLSRAALADAFEEQHPLTRICAADCGRAVVRLGRATDSELTDLDPYLQNGLAGIILAVKTYRASRVGAQHPLPAGFESRLLAALEVRSKVMGGDDLSLLTGAAGLAYAWLKLSEAAPQSSCINPLSRASIPAARKSHSGEALLPLLIEPRLPRTAAVVALSNPLNSAVVSLTEIERITVDHRTENAASIEVIASNYELGLSRQLAEIPSFRHHLFRENYKRMRFAQSYADGMNDVLLMERFRLDEDVSLMELEFDPCDSTPRVKTQKTLIIRYRGSCGIVDAKLSMLQHALLERFRKPAVVIDVIGDVIKRIQTQNVTQRELAELSLKLIRSYVAACYLFPETPGKIQSLLIRRRFRHIKMNLFPAEVSR